MRVRKTPTIVMFIIVFSLLLATNVYGKDIRIVTPYLGSIKNIYENEEYNLDLEDSSLFKGLYLQWVDPERYQWNAFIYQSSDINYSTLWGGHFIFDYYLGVRERGKYVVGTGIELIRLDMDAGNNISGLFDFELLNNIYVLYFRTGRYFYLGNDTLKVSLLPWAGFQPQWVRGNISFNFGGPFPPPVEKDIEENDIFAIAGLNVKTNIFHFLEVEAKYQAAFNTDDYFSTLSGMINLFLTRHWGLSYRFKYMETSSGSDTYHIGGVVFAF